MSRRRIDPQAGATTTETKSSGRRARRGKPASANVAPATGIMSHADRRGLALAVSATITAGIFHQAGGNESIAFIFTALAIAALTNLVGNSIEALGDRIGPRQTALLQSFFGNIPLFFVLIFAVRDGLYEVAKAAIVGSLLGRAVVEKVATGQSEVFETFRSN